MADRRLSHSRSSVGVDAHSTARGQQRTPTVRRVTLGVMALWLVVVAGAGWWMSQRSTSAWLARLASSAEYEGETTARVINRLFTEMSSVANMVAHQSQVIQLAKLYRHDPPGFADLPRQERANTFARDQLVRKVGDYMNALSSDLHYGRIYMNNLSDDTVATSNWADSDSIAGMIYTRRAYLMDAMREGVGYSFGIARLLKIPSYFVASRIEDENDEPLGSVTVRFDASEVARYLTGQHVALIVNRQGRVTTASSESFMLRNVAALLPPEALAPPEDEEGPGEPMNLSALNGESAADGQWLIDGNPYLLQRHALSNTRYQLLTLADLSPMASMRKGHVSLALAVAGVGLVLILLSSRLIGQAMARREDERFAANNDLLTGLPNRRAVLAELDRMFALAQRTQQRVMVAFIDLDGFKAINDSYGHEIGDKFLKEVGRRMSAGLRAGDMLGRWGGDEFVVVGLMTVSSDMACVDKALAAMHHRLAPMLVGTYCFGDVSFEYPGASIGIVSADPLTSSRQSVLKEADQRMYADKQLRRQAGQ